MSVDLGCAGAAQITMSRTNVVIYVRFRLIYFFAIMFLLYYFEREFSAAVFQRFHRKKMMLYYLW